MAQKFNKSEKSSAKSLKDSAPPPLPFAHQMKGAKEKDSALGTRKKGGEQYTTMDESVDEMLTMIQHMRKIHDDIDKMLDEVIQQTGWTPKYLKAYLSNPNNFEGETWESLQRQRKELMDIIKTPRDIREEKKAQMTGKNAPQDPKIAKERRTKTVGARRNWLPMR